MRLTLVTGAALAIALAHAPATAQMLDVEVGGGYVFGGGIANPSPSLATVDVGASVWPWQHWGIAVRLVEGPGEDLYDNPVGDVNRTLLGEADLHYVAIGARRRWTLSPKSGFELGFGMALDGRFSNVVDFSNPAIGRQTQRTVFFETLMVEGYYTRAFGRRFAIKTGVSYDTNVETANLQPLALASMRIF